ncbi:MAG: ABC transporter permease [Candidatus Micrarchaeia archaeon]
MKLTERFSYALKNLKHRPLRTWLTVLGVVVGIAAIIVLVGLAGGLRKDVDRQLSSFDPRVIIIFPINIEARGASLAIGTAFQATSGKLFERDYEKIKSIAGVEQVTKILYNFASVKHRNQILTATIYAVEPDNFMHVSTVKILEGRFIEPGERGTAVFGYSIAKDTFDEEVRLGSIVEISGKKYRVVGILEKTGNTYSQIDNVIFLSYDDGREMFKESLSPNEISAMRVLVSEGTDVNEVAERIEDVLMNLHKVKEDEKDFTVITQKVIIKQVDSVIGILTLFLGTVALIALLVGTIGISNTMFMAVMERTREVGILKSIGTTKKEIMYIFLIEAGIIGLLGGVLGILLGLEVSWMLTLFGVETYVSIEFVIGSALFGFLVGVVAGVIPAKNASEVPAIEALRYE